MKDSIFEALTYVEWIRIAIENHADVRGYQGKLATAAGVHASYFSRVLQGQVDLSPDQAMMLCEFWAFTSEETQLFLEMVQLARSTHPALKRFFQKKITQIKERKQRISARLKEHAPAPTLDPGLYYSTWYYSAVHMALTIPELRTPATIAERLQVAESLVELVLGQLQDMGYARLQGEHWEPAQANIHLGDRQYFSRIQHTNWRIKTVQKIQEPLNPARSLFYTGVHSLSKSDFQRLKGQLAQLIENSRRLISDSPEETLVCLSVDWYEL